MTSYGTYELHFMHIDFMHLGAELLIIFEVN